MRVLGYVCVGLYGICPASCLQRILPTLFTLKKSCWEARRVAVGRGSAFSVQPGAESQAAAPWRPVCACSAPCLPPLPPAPQPGLKAFPDCVGMQHSPGRVLGAGQACTVMGWGGRLRLMSLCSIPSKCVSYNPWTPFIWPGTKRKPAPQQAVAWPSVQQAGCSASARSLSLPPGHCPGLLFWSLPYPDVPSQSRDPRLQKPYLSSVCVWGWGGGLLHLFLLWGTRLLPNQKK